MSDRYLEHPDITHACETGYPWGKEDTTPDTCPCCGGQWEKLYKSRSTWEILGCDWCIDEVEWEVD